MATPVHGPAAEQLRAAISILASAAGDRQWGSGDLVTVRAGGRLRIGQDQRPVGIAVGPRQQLAERQLLDVDDAVGPGQLGAR